MPELPEVETVVRTLESKIKDLTITDVEILYPKMILDKPSHFKKMCIGESFRQFSRRGKYILFQMDTFTLVSHLRMEGKYYIQKPSEPRDKHMHVIFHLSDGSELRYRDTRKFGRMEIYPFEIDLDYFHDLGYEPFDERLNAQYFHSYIKNKKLPLKTLLLDQHFISGIGNIYADEILFACGLRPQRSCKRITKKDEENIIKASRMILQKAIEKGGTTIRSYTSSLGVTGLFQLDCAVHEKKICKKCDSEIKMKRIGGRSSYYCPKCQK